MGNNSDLLLILFSLSFSPILKCWEFPIMSLNQILSSSWNGPVKRHHTRSHLYRNYQKYIPTAKDAKSSYLYCVFWRILVWLYNRNQIREQKTAVLPHRRTLGEATNQTPPLSRQLSTMGLIKISDPTLSDCLLQNGCNFKRRSENTTRFVKYFEDITHSTITSLLLTFLTDFFFLLKCQYNRVVHHLELNWEC